VVAESGEESRGAWERSEVLFPSQDSQCNYALYRFCLQMSLSLCCLMWRSQVTELCFFGRLEVRKGIVLFADALDALLELNATEVSGKEGLEDGRQGHQIRKREPNRQRLAVLMTRE